MSDEAFLTEEEKWRQCVVADFKALQLKIERTMIVVSVLGGLVIFLLLNFILGGVR